MFPLVAELNGVEPILIRDRVLTAQIYGGTAGDYPWTRSESVAKEAGVPQERANLGRALFGERVPARSVG